MKQPLKIELTVSIGEVQYGGAFNLGADYTHEDIRKCLAEFNRSIKMALNDQGISNEDLGDSFKLPTL